MMEQAVGIEEMEKPPYSYVALIALVLEESPDRRLPLRAIYEAIARRFPYYARLPGKGWQNCIRHSLSLNPCFIRLPRQAGHKSSLWVLDPSVHNMFERGNYRRRRRQKRQETPAVGEAAPPPQVFRYHDPAGYHLPLGHYPLLSGSWGARSPLIYPGGHNPIYTPVLPRSFQNDIPATHYWEQEVQHGTMGPSRMEICPPPAQPLCNLRSLLTD